MIHMKKTYLWMLAAILTCGLSLTACSNKNDDTLTNSASPTDEQWHEKITSNEEFVFGDEYKYTGKAFVSPLLDEKIVNVLSELMTDRQQTFDKNAEVVVLNDFTDIPFEQLEEAYYSGAIIAVSWPTQAEIDQFFQAHPDWEGHRTDPDVDNAVLYAFDYTGYNWTVVGQKNSSYRVTLDDPNDAILLNDPFFARMKDEQTASQPTNVPAEEEGYTQEDIKFLVGEWVKSLVDEKNLSEEMRKQYDEESAQARRYLMARAAADNVPVDVKAAFGYKTYGKTFKFDEYCPWYEHLELYKGVTWKISWAKFTLSVRYNVYSLHTYDGLDGQGDYYLITMESDMNFNGCASQGVKWSAWHNYYWIEPFGKSFEVCTFPATTTDQKTSRDYNMNEVSFLNGKGAIPETTQGSTSYSDEYSFSAKLDASVSAKADVKFKTDSTGKMPMAEAGAGVEAKIGASWGWSWAEKVSRSVGDISIKNTSARGNDQGHEIVYENLPKSDKSQGWIEQKGNHSYKATTKLKSVWGWYKKDERDGSKNPALVLHLKGRIDYQYWYHDGAYIFNVGSIDEYKRTQSAYFNSYFQLDPIYRERVGQIELKNDMDKTYIKNIKLYPTDNPSKVQTFPRTYAAGEKINLGCRLISGKYTIEFDAQKAGSNKTTTYKYSSHDYLPLDHLRPNVFYAAADFKAK